MDSSRLSRRTKQPGHDRTFEHSELSFIESARNCLDSTRYEVVAKPRDLRDLFPGDTPQERALGIELEAVIVHLQTGRRLYVEVKKQGKAGNADERACKHHTVQFYRTMHAKFGYDYHPIITVFCEELAVMRRYTHKWKFYFEPDQYFNWADYDIDLLRTYLRGRCEAWLEQR